MEQTETMQGAERQHPNSPTSSTGRGFRIPIAKDELLRRIGFAFLKDVKRRGREFMKTDAMKRQAVEIARFLTEEDDKYGLFVCGKVGNGKSTMMRAVCNTINAMVRDGVFSNGGEIYDWDYMLMVDAREMARIYIRDYDEEFRLLKTRRFLIIDDLGTEPRDVVLYGTVFNPFMELLDYRYEKMLPTIIATNLNTDKVVEKYADPRLPDRMREMFEVLSFEDKSFRV